MSLLGVKQTSASALHMSAFDLERTSCHGAKAGICLGLGIVVYRPGATCSDAVKADSRLRASVRFGTRLAKRQSHPYPLPTYRNNSTGVPANSTRRFNSRLPRAQ